MRSAILGAALLAAAMTLAAAAAQAPAATWPGDSWQSLDALFEAAARGETGAVASALDGAADADLRAVLAARIAVARGDPRAAADPALARLAASPDPARRRSALAVLTLAAFAADDYAEAARAGRLYAEAIAGSGPSDRSAEAERGWRVAALLAGQPGQRVERIAAGGSAPARIDAVGLPRIDIAVNGAPQEAVFDTGAGLSVLSAGAAARLGVRVIDSPAEVGNGVAGSVAARIGIADRVEIGGAVLRNVAFLIIDDAQLTFPVAGGYRIDAIVGMPVMRALGRMRMESAGRLVIRPEGEAAAGAPNLHASGNVVYADVAIDGRSFPLLLDTGANQTSLTALYVAAVPSAVAGLEIRTAGTASAGGAREQQVATWRDAPLSLGGRGLRLPALPIALAGDGPPARSYGTLGSNALRAFESYTLDFSAMRLELGAPVASATR